MQRFFFYKTTQEQQGKKEIEWEKSQEKLKCTCKYREWNETPLKNSYFGILSIEV